MGCFKSSAYREVHSNNLTYNLKKIGKEECTKPKVSRRKEIMKIREEINKKKFKRQWKKSVKPRAGSLKG